MICCEACCQVIIAARLPVVIITQRSLSEILSIFAPTRCVDEGEIWRGGVDLRSTVRHIRIEIFTVYA